MTRNEILNLLTSKVINLSQLGQLMYPGYTKSSQVSLLKRKIKGYQRTDFSEKDVEAFNTTIECITKARDFPIPKLRRLTEMGYAHFGVIFTKDFAKHFTMQKILQLNSLYAFHKTIAEYGHFESYRKAIELGYDVEFTLDR